MSKDWRSTPVIKKWLEMRKESGAALRKAVWNDLEPLRKAMEKTK